MTCTASASGLRLAAPGSTKVEATAATSAWRGDAVSGADAVTSGINQWQVSLQLRGGAEGIDAWNAIAEDCFFGAENCPGGRIAIELDGNWHRQDLDHVLARRALDAGCLFALDSDAHSIPELRFSEYAVAHGRLAGIPAARVINCWSDDELDAWMAERRQP